MFKNISNSDKSIRCIELFANQSLNSGDERTQILHGISGSSNHTSSSIYGWANNLYYTTGSYSVSIYQNKNTTNEYTIIKISPYYFGYKIKPNSLRLDIPSANDIIDDGYGNISSGSIQLGNIFYSHGTIIFTNSGSNYQNFNSFTVNFKSTHYIYEHSYLCRIESGEMNYTTNPSFIWGKDAPSGSDYNEVRFSECPVFITTIGLYDDENRLLAIGHLASPIKKSSNMDMNFLVRFDL